VSCENCEDLRFTIRALRRQIETLEKDAYQNSLEASKKESEIRSLKPYRDSYEKNYDRFVSTPAGMP